MAATEVNVSQKTYKGAGISIRSLEESLGEERQRQNVDLDKLKSLKSQNEELSKALEQEIKKLRKFSDFVSKGDFSSFGAKFKELMSYLPGIGKMFVGKRSIEQLLKQQYEISSRRTHEVANYADRLEAAEHDLYLEIRRLNDKIIEHAQNEEVAADNVLALKTSLEKLEQELALPGQEKNAAYREKEASLDKVRELLSEHSTKLELYGSAEERLNRLKENTRRLQQTISNLHSDIKKYVMVATEKLDEAQAHIQALGTAADASVVMLDMKASLDSMQSSINDTTKFVSETQMYLRENLDSLISDLEMYDTETQTMVDANLQRSKAIEDALIDKAVSKALETKQKNAKSAQTHI
ncbi:MAG: hypothetical protein JXR76_09955 [Deltaproteobacteria bacterium]|nr:hypothetical protein [Deltaproteobacteria bacterium]